MFLFMFTAGILAYTFSLQLASLGLLSGFNSSSNQVLSFCHDLLPVIKVFPR